ncbi:MAG: CPBP family intramembrane glutamic endopeptidase [Candidatus Promineifilaceae bacterium]|nr:CPBP family intramembrane glutamic endopeptidase [Candidatus Promineifilaceae bacterium]
MLFSSKRCLPSALLLFVLFTALSLAALRLLDLQWAWSLRPRWLIAGLALVAISDGLLHGALALFFGRRYLRRYRSLARYFSPQGSTEIVASGFLAAGEELFFRGVLLQGAIGQLGWHVVSALVLTALAFALLHLITRPALAPFALWALWEGVLLGTVYLMSGSILTVALVHALHDAGGFALFALQRRTGWLAGGATGERGFDSIE